MRAIIRSALRRLGYDITRWKQPAPEPGFNAWHLMRLFETQPRTIFDVGVGNGTSELYRAFPKSRFVLVEPLQEYASIINEIAASHDVTAIYKAVGSAPGKLELLIDADHPEGSSFQERSALTRPAQITRRTVEVTTLDDILADMSEVEKPILVKVDTEGYELEVLKGAANLLREAEIVIAEVSVAHRFEGGYHFEDVVTYMVSQGYRLHDILFIARAATEVEPRFMDVVFKKDVAT